MLVAELQPDIIFQKDGASIHCALIVKDVLDDTFPGRWISRGESISLPARSPDITPLDFFSWGFLKDTVYKIPVRYLQELRACITEVTAHVHMDILHRTWQEVEYSIDILCATDGAYFELS